MGQKGPQLTAQEQQVAKAPNPFQILGTPTPSKYESLRDASGALKSQFQVAPSFESQVRGGGDVERLRGMATAQGLSEQAKLQQQDLAQKAQEQAQQGLASSWTRMASRGGIDAGARERLARGSQRDLSRNLSDIGLQTSLADQEQKMKLATMLPQLQLAQEGAIMGAKQADIGSMIGDIGAKQAFEQQRFADQMKALGAEKQAIAEKAKAK